MAQFARPSSDISTGWATTPLWSKIDEVTPDDGDFITGTGSTVTAEVKLSTVTDPLDDTNHIWSFRTNTTGSGGPERLTVELYQGTTLIEQVIINQALTRSWALWTGTLVNAANITDYSDLRFRLVTGANGASETVDVSWMELSVPDESAPANIEESISLAIFKAETVSETVAGEDLLHIDFEGGDKSEFNTETNGTYLSVTTNAGMVGVYGMEVDCTTAAGADAHGNNPLSIGSEITAIRFRFYIDVSNLTLGAADAIYPVWMNSTYVASLRMAHLELRELAGDILPILGVQDDSDTTRATTGTPTPLTGEHYIECVIYREVTDGSADGYQELYIDGNLQSGTDVNIENYNNFLSLSGSQLGADSLDVTTTGTLYLDDFIVRDNDTLIGPAGISAIEESVGLAKSVGQSAAELGNVQESVALSKVNTVVPSTLISGEEVVNLNRVGAIVPSAFGIFDQSVSMARSIGLSVLEDFTTTIQEAVSLSRLLAAAATSQEVSIEEVNLAKVAAVSTASQLVAYSATSLNRINTIPANTLGTLYELVNLAHLDGLSVLEETQGQTNESVSLNRVLATLAETLVEGYEDVSLAQVLGLISDSQETSQEAVDLGASHGLTVLEETQGSVEESVILTRLMGIVSSSQAVMQDGLTLNRYFTLGTASKHVAMESVIFGSTYGLSSAVFPQISELVLLARINSISLADNVTTIEAVNLLISLFMTVEPSSVYDISRIHENNVFYVKYRDKRYRVIFRDKRG